MKRKKKKRALRLGLFMVCLWLSSLLMMYIQSSDAPQRIPMYKPVQTVQSNHGSSASTQAPMTTAVPMASTSTALFHHDAAPTPTMPATSREARTQMTSVNGGKLYTTSIRATRVEIGGGRGNGGGAGTNSPGYASQPLASSVNMSMQNALAYTTIPLAARSVQGGITADQGMTQRAIRRSIIVDGDDYNQDPTEDPLNPGYNPNDPFLSPLGDANGVLLLLCAMYAAYSFLRRRKQNGTYLH